MNYDVTGSIEMLIAQKASTGGRPLPKLYRGLRLHPDELSPTSVKRAQATKV